ncbi:MerR family transcriptional regulator [Collinsella sp. zg1085]|uniref:MerR family transcriptional regulator n=1 Tax=Collinsella sp. zg1085 TaxID=2844380 RepID=UPI001C0BB12F|nr:MerR family transcriptional regulator [Collinsella sp. zg1085]QWT18200.1 MerR family transcriptional regulator [Collinsella sp. zg1085]
MTESYLKIGEVADRFNIPVSTLRYYDKQGFFPELKRSGGQRLFSETELQTLHVIECLKLSGLSLEQIATFIGWCAEGDTSLAARYELFCEQKRKLKEQYRELERLDALLTYKQWYYKTALEAGSEAAVRERGDDEIPADILVARSAAYRE